MKNSIKKYIRRMLVLFIFISSNYSIINYVKSRAKSVFKIFDKSFFSKMHRNYLSSYMPTFQKEFSLQGVRNRNNLIQKLPNNIDHNGFK